MKVLAQKKQTLSLEFPLPRLARNTTSVFKRAFKYSLVNPKTSVPSTADFMRVSNVTVREGGKHRVWPPDVLRRFQMAEIITDLQTPHYVVRDTSISRIANRHSAI